VQPPAEAYSVAIADGVIQVHHDGGRALSLPLSDLRRILVETNASGPWGLDVWWILEGSDPEAALCFPLGAIGEEAFLSYAKTLAGFEIRGMNSTANARFECWPDPAA
jgi:hypothetical protein